MREHSRSRGDNDNPNWSGIVRRMVSLPRSILGGFSRAIMGRPRFDLMGRNNDRANQVFPPNPNPNPNPNLPPTQVDPNRAMMMIDEWAFLNNFEHNYGVIHPFFYACRFIQGLKIAQDEKKLVFLYMHSPHHPFTAQFCRDTLCSEIVVQYIDANFVSWAGICDTGEGLEMCRSLRPPTFPFCAVIAPPSASASASADNIALLQQIEGPVSPAELVEILQRTLEEQGAAFRSSEEEEKRREDRRLREDQDTAYLASLILDQDKEKHRKSTREETVQKLEATSASDSGLSQWPGSNSTLNKPGPVTERYSDKRENQYRGNSCMAKDNQVTQQKTQILIRFPNGERREHSFSTTDKVQAIYEHIDSLNLPGIGSYRLISSFPRKVYDANLLEITLQDAGLHPRATLFLDLS